MLIEKQQQRHLQRHMSNSGSMPPQARRSSSVGRSHNPNSNGLVRRRSNEDGGRGGGHDHSVVTAGGGASACGSRFSAASSSCSGGSASSQQTGGAASSSVGGGGGGGGGIGATPLGPPPRRIKRSEGRRLRLLFGETPASYVLLMDEDDGSAQWQTVLTSNLPRGLEEQIVRITERSGHVTDVAFSPDGRWYVQARFPDGADAGAGGLVDMPPNSSNSSSVVSGIGSASGGGKAHRRASLGSVRSPMGSVTAAAGGSGHSRGGLPQVSANNGGVKKTWWGGTSEKVSLAIEEWSKSNHRLQVSFGDEGQCFLLQGDNGHWDCGYAKVEPGLKSRVDRRYKDGGKIDFIRLFPFYSCSDSYVISDSEGTKWFGLCEHLANELRHTAAEETVCDVTMSGDQAWCVVYHHRFAQSPPGSSGSELPPHLAQEMKRFMARQRARREKRDKEIAAFREAEAAFREQSRREGNLREALESERRTLRSQRERDAEEIRELRALLERERAGSAVRGLRVGMRVTVAPAAIADSGNRHALESSAASSTANGTANPVIMSEGSVHPGDAVIISIDSDRSSNRHEVTVRYDDGSTQVIRNDNVTSSIEIFDERSRLRSIEADLDRQRCDYRSKRIELYARKRRLYLWRGLRSDEHCRAFSTTAATTTGGPPHLAAGLTAPVAHSSSAASASSGILAKDPGAALSLEDALLRSAAGEATQYVPATLSPEAAVYYAATHTGGGGADETTTQDAALSSSPCRVAQIDRSLVPESSTFDLSTADLCARHGVHDPRAVRYAVDHRVVLVRAYVPPESIVGVHDLRPLGVPRNPPSSTKRGSDDNGNDSNSNNPGDAAPEYLRKLSEAVPSMPDQIAGWIRTGVQRLLEEECQRFCAAVPVGVGPAGGAASAAMTLPGGMNARGPHYPEHVVALAVVRGSVRAPREFEPLWRKIVGHR